MNWLHRAFVSIFEKPLPKNRRIIFPGRYSLQRDLVVDDNLGILINCSGVLLNLNGHRISHANGAAPGSFGILSAGHRDVTIINGCIDGFWHAVHLSDTFNSKISGVTIRNTGYIGICVTGEESQISDNRIEDQRIDLPRTTKKYVVGIHLTGRAMMLDHNHLVVNPNRAAADVEYVAILVSGDTTEIKIRANSMRALAYLPKSYGVWIASQSQVVVAENDIGNFQFAVVSDSDTAEVTDNILRNDEVHPDTHGVHVPNNVDKSLVAGNTIEGFQYVTILQRNDEPEAG